MTWQITYRSLAASDQEFCVRVHHLAMRAYVEPLWGWDEARQDRLARHEIADPHAIHEIALLGPAPIGYLSYQDLPDVLYLDTLFLHPDHQGRGYGCAIMARLIALAHSHGKPIELSVLTTNPRAQDFYARLGFFAVTATAERIWMRNSPRLPDA
jgi:GNAT superfamily N-acetyltransferase